MKNIQTINISSLTFIKTVVLLLIIAFLYLVKEVLALIFLAIIFSSAVDPWVSWLKNKKIPKSLSILTIYVLAVGIISTIFILIIPTVAREISQLARLFPEYYQQISEFFNKFKNVQNSNLVNDVQVGLNTVSSSLSSTISSIFNTTAQIFGGIFSFITILVISFYFTTEENAIKKFTDSIIPKKYRPYTMDLFLRIQSKLGQWLRGQLTLSIIIFVITFLGLALLSMFFSIKYVLVLALLAGILEIVPYFGPWISGVIAVLLTLTQSGLAAIFVGLLYLIVQQLENSIIVPKFIGKSVGLNPIVVIVAILVGFKLAGVIGGLISVPIAAALSVFIVDFLDKREFKKVV